METRRFFEDLQTYAIAVHLGVQSWSWGWELNPQKLDTL